MIIDGINYKAEEVKKIGEKYYVIGKTCFKISNKWRSIDDPEVAYDESKKTYGLKSKMVFGVVNPEKWGYFTPTNRSVETPKGIFLEFNDCPYKLSYDGKKYPQVTPPQIVKPFELSYNFDLKFPYIEKIVKAYADFTPQITSEARMFSTLLKGYSFGLEYETNNGTLPYDKLGELGLVPLKDGSLRRSDGKEPFEYATVPLSGAKGIQSILDQCLFLEELATYDNDCSLHIHIGGIRKDRRVIVALYKLCHAIQNHLYDLVPYSKRDPEYFYGAKLKSGEYRKNYARLLPGLPGTDEVQMLQGLFSFVSNDRTIEASYGRGSEHYEKNKWNRYNRYSIVNFEHLLLGNSNTVEFRVFDMTTSGEKAAFLVAICVAIVRYAEAYSNNILNGFLPNSLEEIILGFKNDFGTTSGNSNKTFWTDSLINFIKELKSKNFYNACAKRHSEQVVTISSPLKSTYKSYGETKNIKIPANPLHELAAATNTISATYDEILNQFQGMKKLILEEGQKEIVEEGFKADLPPGYKVAKFDVFWEQVAKKELEKDAEFEEKVIEVVGEIQELENAEI